MPVLRIWTRCIGWGISSGSSGEALTWGLATETLPIREGFVTSRRVSE